MRYTTQRKGGEVKMKAYVNKILYVAAALALLMGLVPAVAYAATATGSFGTNNAAPNITSVTLQQSDKTNTTSSMTPLTAFDVEIQAGDANTINDITQIDITLFYENDGNHNTVPAGAWDCDQEAIYQWSKTGNWTMQNGGATTTWTITTASCDNTSDMTATSGEWNLYFTPGKLAEKADGATTNAWNIRVNITDAQGATANMTAYNNSMGTYSSLALNTSTVDFGAMATGATQAIQTPDTHYITLQAICNNVFSLKANSSATWTAAGSKTVTLDVDGTPASHYFSLNQSNTGDGSGHPNGSTQWITATSAIIIGHSTDARTETAPSASEARNDSNMYMDCILGTGIAVGTYSGTLTYTITSS